MDMLIDGYTDGWTDSQMMDGGMDGWIDERWMDGGMDGQIDGWREGQTDDGL